MPPSLPKWTLNKPTEPGVYQYRPPHAGVIVFYQVEPGPNGQLVAMIQGSLEQWDLADMGGTVARADLGSLTVAVSDLIAFGGCLLKSTTDRREMRRCRCRR